MRQIDTFVIEWQDLDNTIWRVKRIMQLVFFAKHLICTFHPFKKPIVNPIDMLLVNGMPKFDIAPLKVTVVVFVNVAIVPSIYSIYILNTI
jgi:hypothetical protein